MDRIGVGRLTIDIPERTHHYLKMMAARRGQSMKEFILARVLPDIADADQTDSLRRDMEAWEAKRAGLRLNRNGRSWHEIIHEGHKW